LRRAWTCAARNKRLAEQATRGTRSIGRRHCGEANARCCQSQSGALGCPVAVQLHLCCDFSSMPKCVPPPAPVSHVLERAPSSALYALSRLYRFDRLGCDVGGIWSSRCCAIEKRCSGHACCETNSTVISTSIAHFFSTWIVASRNLTLSAIAVCATNSRSSILRPRTRSRPSSCLSERLTALNGNKNSVALNSAIHAVSGPYGGGGGEGCEAVRTPDITVSNPLVKPSSAGWLRSLATSPSAWTGTPCAYYFEASHMHMHMYVHVFPSDSSAARLIEPVKVHSLVHSVTRTSQ